MVRLAPSKASVVVAGVAGVAGRGIRLRVERRAERQTIDHVAAIGRRREVCAGGGSRSDRSSGSGNDALGQNLANPRIVGSNPTVRQLIGRYAVSGQTIVIAEWSSLPVAARRIDDCRINQAAEDVDEEPRNLLSRLRRRNRPKKGDRDRANREPGTPANSCHRRNSQLTQRLQLIPKAAGPHGSQIVAFHHIHQVVNAVVGLPRRRANRSVSLGQFIREGDARAILFQLQQWEMTEADGRIREVLPLQPRADERSRRSRPPRLCARQRNASTGLRRRASRSSRRSRAFMSRLTRAVEPGAICADGEAAPGRVASPVRLMVIGQIMPINPAAAVRGPRHVVRLGKTPVLDPAEARQLIDAIDTTTVIGCATAR